jgi:Carbohydrate binding module (family 6)
MAMNNFWNIKSCCIVMILWATCFPLLAQVPLNYKGKPFIDGISSFSMQTIPGRMELAFFDDGGEGVAYHDTTVTNDGAVLNHTNGHHRPGITPYVAFFREKEGVDISYTKDWADFNHPNKVDPKVNQLYIGWEEDGEWTNYTVDVLKAGKYRIITVYSNDDNAAELWVDGVPKTKLKLPVSTGNWHYWDQATVGEIIFEKAGQHLITFKYNRGANWAYLDFLLVGEFK